ncbi:hypothetical protein M408DRAFT_325481 [Serendipita vermifera MAFF 305830]|uniref:Uncharacterized protein n=1 Tax=Serendipita vermifera MAFF 305830 TaxID=933852 RepID=A0A0C3BAR9_SERVB|nr:hypothetical protein M408DRAFT_325481 [Serendipita vermifera MAFF 305830]
MESDSEDELFHSFPYLVFYQKEETQGRVNERSARLNGEEIGDWKRAWRDYRNLRFYRSIIGFHEGTLDLSGRHEERYTRLKITWDEYFSEFQELEKTATPMKIEKRIGELIIPDVEYTFSDAALWQEFTKKWHISPTFGVHAFAWTDRVRGAMKKHPKPKIQSLCLHHLPVELIQQVYAEASQANARILSSTSRYMRSLALPYIFGERRLQFGPGLYWYQSLSDPGIQTQEDVFEALQALARTGRDSYIETIEYILSRPDLLRSLTSLSLFNLWSRLQEFENSRAEGFSPINLDADYFLQIHQHNARFLQATIHLTSLKLGGFDIDCDLVRATTSLPSLVTLQFDFCSLTSELQASALEPNFPKYEQVLNLSIGFKERNIDQNNMDVNTEAWYLIPLCPNMKTLSVRGMRSRKGVILPRQELWHAVNPFKTLERFAIEELVGWEVETLGLWIQNASVVEQRHLMMTHFMLRSKGSFDGSDTAVLANALGHATNLEVCVLDGIASQAATVALIDVIAHALPDIIGLTLIVSDRWHDLRSDLRAWPSPMWEYGSQFSTFTHLKYFGWNNRFECEYTPAQMIFLEEGYPERTPEGLEQEHLVNRMAFLLDFERTGAVFGAYCPSLKTVAVTATGGIFHAACLIRRDGNEHMIVEKDSPGKNYADYVKWNPDGMLSDGWPPILPKSL